MAVEASVMCPPAGPAGLDASGLDFLCGVFDGSTLSSAVVRDVWRACSGDSEQAMQTLIMLADASEIKSAASSSSGPSSQEDHEGADDAQRDRREDETEEEFVFKPPGQPPESRVVFPKQDAAAVAPVAPPSPVSVRPQAPSPAAGSSEATDEGTDALLRALLAPPWPSKDDQHDHNQDSLKNSMCATGGGQVLPAAGVAASKNSLSVAIPGVVTSAYRPAAARTTAAAGADDAWAAHHSDAPIQAALLPWPSTPSPPPGGNDYLASTALPDEDAWAAPATPEPASALAAYSSAGADDEAAAQLRAMFPEVDADVVEGTLRAFPGDLQAAAAMLADMMIPLEPPGGREADDEAAAAAALAALAADNEAGAPAAEQLQRDQALALELHFAEQRDQQKRAAANAANAAASAAFVHGAGGGYGYHPAMAAASPYRATGGSGLGYGGSRGASTAVDSDAALAQRLTQELEREALRSRAVAARAAARDAEMARRLDALERKRAAAEASSKATAAPAPPPPAPPPPSFVEAARKARAAAGLPSVSAPPPDLAAGPTPSEAAFDALFGPPPPAAAACAAGAAAGALPPQAAMDPLDVLVARMPGADRGTLRDLLNVLGGDLSMALKFLGESVEKGPAPPSPTIPPLPAAVPAAPATHRMPAFLVARGAGAPAAVYQPPAMAAAAAPPPRPVTPPLTRPAQRPPQFAPPAAAATAGPTPWEQRVAAAAAERAAAESGRRRPAGVLPMPAAYPAWENDREARLRALAARSVEPGASHGGNDDELEASRGNGSGHGHGGSRRERGARGPRVGRAEAEAQTAETQRVYEESRALGDQCRAMQTECFTQAAALYQAGRGAEAQMLAARGREFGAAMRKANEAASERIFQARNRSIENHFEIDLHGCHVTEALGKVDRVLAAFSALASRLDVKIICGRGSHSADGRPRVLPAIKHHLDGLGIRYREAVGGNLHVKLLPPG